MQWKPYSPSGRTANTALLCTLSSDMGSNSRALLRGVNEFVSALHTFIARFRIRYDAVEHCEFLKHWRREARTVLVEP